MGERPPMWRLDVDGVVNVSCPRPNRGLQPADLERITAFLGA
ncbi:hypothetical protein [Micromonospora sp. SL4-19]